MLPTTQTMAVKKSLIFPKNILQNDQPSSSFPQDEEVHKELELYLESELGEFMAPDWVGRNSAPSDLWHLNKTLIVAYHHPITW